MTSITTTPMERRVMKSRRPTRINIQFTFRNGELVGERVVTCTDVVYEEVKEEVLD